MLNNKKEDYMKKIVLGMAMFLLAGLAFGADIDGKWIAEIPGMDGAPMKINYTFKANGATLTGSTASPDGKEIQIKDGKIDGNKISFVLAMDMGGQEMKITCKGEVAGPELKMSMDMGMGEPMAMTFKKAQ
jgi:hypothetical protein